MAKIKRAGFEIEVGDGGKRSGNQPHDREQQLDHLRPCRSEDMRVYCSRAERTWFNQVLKTIAESVGALGLDDADARATRLFNPARRDRAKDLRDLAAPYARKA